MWMKRALASTVVLFSMLALPQLAQARFGKHSDDSDSDSDKRRESSRSSSSEHTTHAPSSSSDQHATRAPSSREYHREPARESFRNRRYRGNHYPYRHGWSYGYRPYFYSPPAVVVVEPGAPAMEPEAEPPTPSVVQILGITGQYHNQRGPLVDLNLGMEGNRWGLTFGYTGILVPSENNNNNEDTLEDSTDAISLFSARLTYALVSTPSGRLRAEGGINGTIAPDMRVLGPDVGISGVMGVVGPLGLEAAAHVTPFPFVCVDTFAGASLTLGPFGLRTGWRSIWLNDRGLVDHGKSNKDTFHGPYIGVALVL